MYRRQIEKKNDDDYDDDNDDKRKYNDIPEKSNQIFRWMYVQSASNK